MTSPSSSTKTGLAKYLSTQSDFQNPTSHASPLPALYADLSRQRKSNPAGYRASIEWWRDILLEVTFKGVQYDYDPPAASSKSSDVEQDLGMEGGRDRVKGKEVDQCVFRLDESTKARWTIDGVGRPLGLGTVISELEKDRSLVSYNTFMRSTAPIVGPSSMKGKAGGLRNFIPTPSGVASALLLTPAKWAASTLINAITGGSGDGDEGEYSEDEKLFKEKRGDWVWVELVHRLASSFLTQHYETSTLSPLSNLLTIAEFKEKLSKVCLEEFGVSPSERDSQLVLKHLTRDRGGVAVFQGGLLKLAPTSNEIVEPISEEDKQIVAVKETLRKLELQILSLEGQISHRNDQIKSSLRSNQKTQAASYLRSRKALEEVLLKRMGTRVNLSGVVLKIEQAQSDVEIMRAYKTSSEALKSVLGKEELKLENAEKVMDSLQVGMEGVDELDGVIRNGVDDEVDEDELESELRELEMEKKAEEEAKKADGEKERREKREEEELKARFEKLRVGGTLTESTPSEIKEETAKVPAKTSGEAIAE